MPSLRAGLLDRRITIQALATTVGTARDVTLTASVLFENVAAGYTPISGTEQFKAGQRMATESGTFRLRWRADWSPDPGVHQLVYHGKTWDVVSVTELGRRVGWDIVAEVRGTSGGG